MHRGGIAKLKAKVVFNQIVPRYLMIFVTIRTLPGYKCSEGNNQNVLLHCRLLNLGNLIVIITSSLNCGANK